MKRSGVLTALVTVIWLISVSWAAAWEISDAYYNLNSTVSIWDGAADSRLRPPTPDYDYTYGDDAIVTYTLPWNFTFYGQTYSRIAADTNGNIWFTATDAAYAFGLETTGRGPVISAWNNDLSSAFQGGVFIQHKTAPERIVIEWQSETYREAGSLVSNTFEVIVFQNGSIRFDYAGSGTRAGDDFGSGISRGDGAAALNLTQLTGAVYSLAGNSYLFTPQALLNVSVAKQGQGNGTISSTPSGISCGSTCSSSYAPGTTVTLSVTPDFGYAFNGWSGACTGSGNCILNMDGAKSISARFAHSPVPMVAISSPSDVVATKSPILNYAVSRGDVVVMVDGQVIAASSGASLPSLSEGAHVVRVEARDSSNSMGYAESTFIVDNAPPALADVIPANGSSNVPVRLPILVRFNEKIDNTSIAAGMVSLTSKGVQVPGSFSIISDGGALIFKSNSRLAYGSSYTFTLKAGVRDAVGNVQVNGLTSTFTTPLIDPDLVGYWPMDDDWHDYSGLENNGATYGSAAFAAGRNTGVKAGDFVIDSKVYSGSGGFVAPGVDYLTSAPNTFTVSFWAKPTGTRTATAEGTSGISGMSGQRFVIGPVIPDIVGASAGVSVGTNGISVFERNGSNDTTSGYSTDYLPSLLVHDTQLSGWNHVVVVYNNKQPSLYLNGQLVQAGKVSSQAAIYPSLTFGDLDTGYGPYSGQMAEVAIFKRALNAQEIMGLYQSSSRQAPAVAITSLGETATYKPGENGAATVTVSAENGMTQFYCASIGVVEGGFSAQYFMSPEVHSTQQLDFQVLLGAAPQDLLWLTCAAQNTDEVLGTGELLLQVADVVPPRVVTATPANNAIDVSATKPITITFSEAMDRSSIISRSTFMFRRADNWAFVPGYFKISDDGKNLITLPSPALNAATDYVITLSGLRDIAGNLLSEYSLRFTTLQQVDYTVSGKGAQTAPYLLPSGRYGKLVIDSSYVSISGSVVADSISISNSTVDFMVGPLGEPGNLSVEYGDLLVSGSKVTINGTLSVVGNVSESSSTISVSGDIMISSDATVTSSTLTIKNFMQVSGSVTLLNNSVMTHFAATPTEASKLELTANSVNIDNSSRIDVSGKGYLGGFQRGNNPFSSRSYNPFYKQYYVPAVGENSTEVGRTYGNTTDGGSGARKGGSYAGSGGVKVGISNAIYGDLYNPNELGSGGGGYNDVYFTGTDDIDQYFSGGSGGGLVRLTVFSLNLYGSISADGASAKAGGGSGGGILVEADTISGNGSINANGGVSNGSLAISGGGGGGGRIAIFSRQMSSELKLAASGGGGYPSGGAGTIYKKATIDGTDQLLVDNRGIETEGSTTLCSLGSGIITGLTATTLSAVGTTWTPGSLKGKKLAPDATKNRLFKVVDNSSSTLYIDPAEGDLTKTTGIGSTYAGTGAYTFTKVTIQGKSQLSSLDRFMIETELLVDNSTFVTNSITADRVAISKGGYLTHWPASLASEYRLELNAVTSISIDSSSQIDVSGFGHLGGSAGGNGAAGRTYDNVSGSASYSGGSYGGYGGAYTSGTVNTIYGDLKNPNEAGSGGGSSRIAYPGGSGGGLIRIKSGSLELEGVIKSDGGDSYFGAGSGGGIRIEVDSLTGNGFIYARGGKNIIDGYTIGGGGGGGRIALYYKSSELPAAHLVASGGTGTPNGGAGTIYIDSGADSNGDVLIASTSRDSVTVLPGGIYGKIVVDNATVHTSGIVLASSIVSNNSTIQATELVADNIVLDSGSVLTHPSATTTTESRLVVNATDKLSISSTSQIDVSVRGYLGGSVGGNGTAGRTYGNVVGSTSNSGGSYGGNGGVYVSGTIKGTVNAAYGSPINPSELGSGGASRSTSPITYPGGNGGGLLLIKAGVVELNGVIKSDGGDSYFGAGSGGGIRIEIDSLMGSGFIYARGGKNIIDGYTIGGGGGGGRIALYYKFKSFLTDTNILASGGLGSPNGGAGTIYIHQGVYPLTVAKSGTGAGVVISTPEGVSCGSICNAQFGTNSSVTLTAIPDINCAFIGWSGACTRTGTCTVTMDAAKSVTAAFNLLPPAVVIASPTGLIRNNRPALQYTISSGSVTVKVDGHEVHKTSGDLLDWLPDGPHTIRVEAVDGSGTSFVEGDFTIDTVGAPLAVVLPVAEITAGYQGEIPLYVDHLPSKGDEVVIEQFVDANRNGTIDGTDYVIRSLKIWDGVGPQYSGASGDGDGAANASISIKFNYYLLNDLFHAPGHYIVKATVGNQSATTPFRVIPLLHDQSVSGKVTNGSDPLAGAIVQVRDKWQRHVTFGIANELGEYFLPLKEPGVYQLVPCAYGYVARNSASFVNVEEERISSDNELVLLKGSDHLYGRCTDTEGGKGVDGLWVIASNAEYTGVAISDMDGRFDVSLPAGTYEIRTSDEMELPNPVAKGYLRVQRRVEDVPVPWSGFVEFKLPLPDVLVTGKVTDSAGNALPGVPMEGMQEFHHPSEQIIDLNEPRGGAISDSGGMYSLGLSHDDAWKIGLLGNYIAHMAPPKFPFSTRTGTLDANDVAAKEVTAWIDGCLKDRGGLPIQKAMVEIADAERNVVSSAITGSDGSFRAGVPAGTWHLDVRPSPSVGLYGAPSHDVTVSDGARASITLVADSREPFFTVGKVPLAINGEFVALSGARAEGVTVSGSEFMVEYPTASSWKGSHKLPATEGNFTSIVLGAAPSGHADIFPFGLNVDRTKPVVRIDSPTAYGVYVVAPVLRFSIKDRNPVRVVIKIDGKEVQHRAGEALDLEVGNHTLLVEATDIAGNTGFGSVVFAVGSVPVPVRSADSFETGDFRALPWVLSGDGMWAVAAGAGFMSSSGAVSPSLQRYGEHAVLEMNHHCVTNGSIRFKYGADLPGDYQGKAPFVFAIDGVPKLSDRGVVPLASTTFSLSPGPHRFTWTYTRHDASPPGKNSVWIDDVLIACNVQKKTR